MTDPDIVSIQKGLEASFKGQIVTIMSGAGEDANSKILFSIESPAIRQPTTCCSTRRRSWASAANVLGSNPRRWAIGRSFITTLAMA
ncbi:MAG: hypothetical protein R3C46_12070 [Hyphomonadaceae bacterium]